MIGIVDSGLGNIGSLLSMLRRLGLPATALTDPGAMETCDRFILPGVGAFDSGMQALKRGGWPERLAAQRAMRRPILGICLGMQLLCEGSDEGVLSGLGWIPGRARRLPDEPGLRIPHMGWNAIRQERQHAVLPDPAARFYFAHSFHVVCTLPEHVLATANHGRTFTAALHADNVIGMQFHPEKSHRFGMRLLEAFARWQPQEAACAPG